MPRSFFRFSWFGLCCLGLVLAAPEVTQADALKENTSLKFVPYSASIFSSTLHMKEQWERFSQSKAYQKLRELPLIKKGLESLREEWESTEDSGLARVREFLKQEENRTLVTLAWDLISHEMFFFADEHLKDVVAQMNQFNTRMNQLQWKQLAEGEEASEEALEELGESIFESIIAEIDKIEVPTVMFGFRTSMPDAARRELPRLQKLLNQAIEEQDDFPARFEMTKVDGSELVVLNLKGSMISWEVAKEQNPDNADDYDRLADKLKDRNFCLALGLFQDYVVLFVGPDLDRLQRLQSGKLLIDSPVMGRLRQFDTKKIVSIGYLSDEFAKRASNTKQQVEQMNDMATALIPMLDLEEELKDELTSDARALLSELEKLIPEPGAMLAFSFLTDQGYEGYTENWGENKFLDGSRPLDILQHVGGDPILMLASNVVSENAFSPRKWLNRGMYYLEKIVLERQLAEEQWDLYLSFREALLPLLQKRQQVTEQHWNQAFQDGQSAFVMDSKLEPKPMWHFIMPPAKKPLPMLEFAQVYALSDREELETSLKKYDEISREIMTQLKEQFAKHEDQLLEMFQGPAAAVPAMIQNAEMPEPLEREIEDGKIRYDMTLQRVGIDSALAPCMGWNSKAYVVALSPSTAERLLQSVKIQGPLAKAQGQKLAAASYFSMMRFVGFLRPWVGYAMNVAAARSEDKAEIEELAPQVDTILEVLQCYRQFYSVTLEGEHSLVTHFRSEFEDLK